MNELAKRLSYSILDNCGPGRFRLPFETVNEAVTVS